MGKITKACASCGKDFKASCGAARFCSDACHFVSGIDKSGACWNWKGAADKDGYGTVKLRGRRVEKAHRLAFRLAKGDIPDGMMVCHECDNPSCCNPAHLFLGTAQDNKSDCVAKGRHVKGRGVYWKAKLSEDDVRAIRADARNSYQVADHYGVSAVLIQQIRKRHVWKHI
jgi:hypothetical protein